MTEVIKGIYTITNIINGKYYVGSSLNVNKRLLYHKNKLLKNKHDNSYLQNAWNKYGAANFKFEVVLDLSHCTEDIIRAVEDDILQREFNQTYNILKSVHVDLERAKTRNGKNRKDSTQIKISKNKSNMYRACLTVKGKKINLGSYKTKEEAIKARLEAQKKYWAEDYVHPQKPICVPLNYRKIEQRVEAYLGHKGIRYDKTFKTEEEAYEYIKNLREELGIIYP